MKKSPIMLAIASVLSFSFLPGISQAENTPNVNSSNKIIFHTHFPYSASDSDLDVFNIQSKDSNGHLINNNFSHAIIASNLIAGVMYTHLMKEKYPKLQFNNEYMIGTMLGQLLQESGLDKTRINTKFAENDDINNPAIKESYLIAGQGGPYQINDYSKKLPFATAKGGLGIVNYDALRTTLGYSIDDQDSGKQTENVGPDSLDNLYFGPMATAFYHFNDVNRLNIESATNWYVNRDAWKKCWGEMTNPELAKNPNALRVTDFIMNVIYNAGDYSPVFSSYLNVCTNQDPSQLASLNDYSLNPSDYRAAIGTKDSGGDTYYRYPRQVSFYADQLFGKDLSKYGLNIKNNVVISINELKNVFAKSMSKLSYKSDPSKDSLTIISNQIVDGAFRSAMANMDISSNRTFSLASESERQSIFKVVDSAISNIEHLTKADFSATSSNEDNPNNDSLVHIYTAPNISGQMYFVAKDPAGNVLNNNYLNPGAEMTIASNANIIRMSDGSVYCTKEAVDAFKDITASPDNIKTKQMNVNFQNSTCDISVGDYKPAPKPDPVKPGNWDPSKSYPGCSKPVNYQGHKYQNIWYANAGETPDENFGNKSDGNKPWKFVDSSLNTCK
ncbi:hypothetical protein JQC92_03745 [Shewanella sp. 202IG2-18]|uniref:hypothetical protein n=1 Tax=Parashewanella hymeniacidonis TaxID=2807618 RepID=UPI001960DCEF|nr:hypothetical protein [Parashewanella hymeniacidonis]MBM7071154.1 hypothetical protein [Parashewanella hymeniacidonis]